jgi:putative PIN family toxin of toxin-antitoxin system
MSAAPRVVLDTNIVLSALLFRQGRLVMVRDAWQSGQCSPLVSHATVAELMRALSYPKFRLSVDGQQELLADYLPFASVVRIPTKPPKTPPCRDRADIAFLQLAKVGRADYLVTGDEDLLSLASGFTSSIVTASTFLSHLVRRKG